MSDDVKKNPRPLVIGIGNPFLQDDRAGLLVLEKLAERGVACDVEDLYTVGFEVVDNCKGRETVYFVDACMLGNEPGTIIEAGVDEIFQTTYLVNSHAATLGTTIKMGYEVFPEEMPETLRVILIEAATVEEFSQEMTPAVEEAVEAVVDRLCRYVDNGCPDT